MHRRLTKALALPAGIVMAGIVPALSAPAQETPPPVYLGVVEDEVGRPIVRFVFSEPGDFDPLWGFSISPRDGECNATTETALDLPAGNTDEPVYDPADADRQLPGNALPVFFATLVSAELSRLGYVNTSEDSLPYHTCTRQVWEALLRR